MQIKFFKFVTVSELRRFNTDVTFIVVTVDFYKMEEIRFNVTCQLICLQLHK
jgi:hypothetical protein